MEGEEERTAAWRNDSHTRETRFVAPSSIVLATVYALFFVSYLLRRRICADCWMDERAL